MRVCGQCGFVFNGSFDPALLETPSIYGKLAAAHRQLAELKGIAASIPNQSILINALTLQEAKDSSAIENIVTTNDELFRDAAFPDDPGSPTAKEVLRYRQAVYAGFNLVLATKLTAPEKQDLVAFLRTL